MECIKIIAVWVLLFFTTLYYTRGQPGGSVLVKLDHLQNPKNTNSAGRCCGKRLPRSKCHPCDYQLSIWVTCDGRTTDSECLYGVGKTRIFYNKSVISFPQDLGNGSRNPLVSNFTSFQGNLGIRILATNRNGSAIHSYRFHQSIYPASYGKKRWTNATLPANGNPNSNTTLSYQVYCKEHYYGPSCSVGCVPGANYNCDKSTGKKLCINGYVGSNCTCKPGHKYNCDSTGKRLCYRPWFGVKCDVKCQERNDGLGGYNCDTKTGAKICLNGWYGPECNQTTPQVSSSLLLTSKQMKVISTIAANNFQKTISTTRGKSNTLLTTKTSIHHITSISKKTMSSSKITVTTLMTSSSQMSSLMTSPLIALPSTKSSLVTPSSRTPLPITSLMTSSTMTSSLMTSSPITSHPFPSHVFSVLTEGGRTRSKRTSMTIRNFTRQTKPPKIIVTTSYLVKLKPLSSYIDLTDITERTFARTSVDSTATSESIKRKKGISTTRGKSNTLLTTKNSIHHITSLSKKMMSSPRITVKTLMTSSSQMKSLMTSPLMALPSTTSLLVTPSSRTPLTITSLMTSSTMTSILMTSSPITSHLFPSHVFSVLTEGGMTRPERTSMTLHTPHDTTFGPESTDARKGDDLLWLLLLPFIVAILMIVIGIAVFKKKNRKRRKITPAYEAPMQEFKVKPEEKSNETDQLDEQDTRNINNNKESCKEDLETIWKVMSTFHE